MKTKKLWDVGVETINPDTKKTEYRIVKRGLMWFQVQEFRRNNKCRTFYRRSNTRM